MQTLDRKTFAFKIVISVYFALVSSNSMHSNEDIACLATKFKKVCHCDFSCPAGSKQSAMLCPVKDKNDQVQYALYDWFVLFKRHNQCDFCNFALECESSFCFSCFVFVLFAFSAIVVIKIPYRKKA